MVITNYIQIIYSCKIKTQFVTMLEYYVIYLRASVNFNAPTLNSYTPAILLYHTYYTYWQYTYKYLDNTFINTINEGTINSNIRMNRKYPILKSPSVC